MIGNYITYRSPKTALTVADILRDNWDDYCAQYPVTPQQAKVAGSMMACRTPQLGGRLDQCGECGALVFRFNSCRDRHCNQCQKYERARWVEKQKVMLLPIPYFHLIFTVDHALNPLISDNQREFYDLLFQTVNQTLKAVAAEKLGCELGFTAVLHTWGQKIDQHVHLHCIVTGGGLALDGRRWVKLANPKYLVDVVKLSALYRDNLMRAIRSRSERDEWRPRGEVGQQAVEAMLAQIEIKKWEVFAKAFEQPEAVYEYLSRYVHQVAISNYRLVKVEDGRVTFRYFENRERAEVGDKGPERELTLPVLPFIGRFMSHILPLGFRRIRYFGLHHSSARQEKLPRCRALLGLDRALPETPELSLSEWLAELLGEKVNQCPHCGAEGALFQRAEFTQLPWLAALILAVVGQPTTQGVCP
jgi:hypothetical protein